MAETEENPESLSAALASLRAKRAKLDAQIELLEELTGETSGAGGSTEGTTSPSFRPSEGQAIRPDEFFGMNILDATEKYLKIVKKPQPLGAVSAALDRGGLMHQSKNFGATVFTTLRRAEDRGDRVVRVPNQGWALESWYPNRPRPVKEEKLKRAKKKKATSKQQAKAKLTVAGAEEAKPSSAATSPEAVAS